MTTAALAAVLAAIQPVVTRAGRIALAGYRGLAREVYALDLRQFASWCRTRSVALSAVRRAGIEAFARELDAMGWARAAARRLSAIAGSCKYAAGEDLRGRAPAVPARRPRAGCESRAAAVDRGEPGALVVAAGLGPPPGPALIWVLARNGLRVCAATGAGISTWA